MERAPCVGKGLIVPPIHRLLCTHCTFGTSELEANTPENAGKVLGYSVRRSSLPGTDRKQLKDLFHAVERLLSYSLPKEATAAQKEQLAADSAPRRLIFVPNLGGWQVAGHISYRSHDTLGRAGSYFADLIVDRAPDPRSRDTAPAWSAVEIVRLWATGCDRKTHPHADWWISSEEQLLALEADGPWKPEPLPAVADVRGHAGPLLDDALLHRFLVAEPGEDEVSGDPLVPARWWRVAAADRRSFVEAVLHAAILGPARGGRETVTIAAEPSVAALVFYAVCRLLPPPIAAAVSFSTYEPSPERPLTGLVATTFIDEENPTVDLPPELYQRGFACNTFRDLSKHGRSQSPPERGYARHVVDLASRAAWSDLDDFLASLSATEGLVPASLDGLPGIDQVVASYLRGEPAGQPQVRARSVEERFLRQRFRAAIEVEAGRRVDWPADIVEKAIKWFGEDLPTLWETSKPLHDVLERFLPADGDALARLLSATPPVPRCVMSEAVVSAARRSAPPAMPRAFTQYCRECCSGSKQRRGEAVNVVGEIVQMFPDSERRSILLTNSSLAFLDLLFDAVRDLDAASCDRLGLPLSDMLYLVVSNVPDKPDKAKEFYGRLAEFLDRHAGVADRVSTSHDGLRAAIRDLFTQLTAPDDGSHLAAERRSRVPGLRKWLGHVGPGTNIAVVFDSWEKLHKSALELADQAKEAGDRFAGALRGMPPQADAALGLAMSAIVALKPLVERAGDDGPRLRCRQARQALATRTFGALSIPVDSKSPPLKWLLDKIEAGLSTTARGESASRSKRKPRFVFRAGVIGCLAAAGGLLGAAYWLAPAVETKSGQKNKTPTRRVLISGSAQPAPADDLALNEARRSGDFGGGNGGKASAQLVANRATVNPSVDVVNAAIVLKWMPRTDISEAPAVKVTDPLEAAHEVPVDLRTGTLSIPTKDRHHGRYRIEWRANSAATWEPLPDIAILPPGDECTKPSSIAIRLNKPEQVTLCLTVSDVPDPNRYGTIHYELLKGDEADLASPMLAQAKAGGGKDLSFDLSRIEYTPTTIRNATFCLRLCTEQQNVVGPPIRIPIPDVAQAFERNLDGSRVPGSDRQYACDLAEANTGAFVSLLEIPWSFDDWEKLQISLLEPRGTVDSVEPLMLSAAMPQKHMPWRFQCKTRDAQHVGYFEVCTQEQDPWVKTLRFKRATEISAAIFDRLSVSMMHITISGLPDVRWSMQFLKPMQLGPMRFPFTLQDLGKQKDGQKGFLPWRAPLRYSESPISDYLDSMLLIAGPYELSESLSVQFIQDDKAKTGMRIVFRGEPLAESRVVFKRDERAGRAEVAEPRLLKKDKKGNFYPDSNCFLRSTKDLREKAAKEVEHQTSLEGDRQRTDEEAKRLAREVEELEKQDKAKPQKENLEGKRKELTEARERLTAIDRSIDELLMPSANQLEGIECLGKVMIDASRWIVALDVVSRDGDGKPAKDGVGKVIVYYGSEGDGMPAWEFKCIRPEGDAATK